MKKFVYCDDLHFILPDSFDYSFEYAGTEYERFRLLKGKTSDDYEYVYLLKGYEIHDDSEDIKQMQKENISMISGFYKNSKVYTFEGDVRAELACYKPEDCEGGESFTDAFAFNLGFFMSDNVYIALGVIMPFSSDEKDTEAFGNMLEVIKGVRTGSGGRIYTGNITAEELKNRLLPERNLIDLDFLSSVDWGDDGEDDGEDDSEDDGDDDGDELLFSLFGLNKKFMRAVPDENLFPHYIYCFCSAPSAVPGVNIVVNSEGTEYSFTPLSSENFKDPVFRKIMAEDTGRYELYKKAKKMQSLFHVNPGVFDSSRDRECEIEQMLMQKAYMFSALRSFLWTVREYCKGNSCSPADIEFSVLSEMLSFIAEKNYLNYDEEKGSRGLCCGSDFNVFFVPDSLKKEDVKELLPTDEDIERIRKLKEKYPTYNEIPAEVHSLDDLRADLEYIYPAVNTLYEELKRNRNYNEALTGDEADIVYAWCIMALAAKEPFLSEDGPFRCFFTQLDGDYEESDDAADTLISQPDSGGEEMERYLKFTKDREEREKKRKKENARKIKEAKAAGVTGDYDINMYIILTNEKKLGRVKRSQDVFFRIYKDLFAAMRKPEIINLRKKILEEMKDKNKRLSYKEAFMERSVEDRFSLTTAYLDSLNDETDPGINAEWAYDKSKEWFRKSEYGELRQLVDKLLEEKKESIDEQLRALNESWTDFSTARDSLEIEISMTGDEETGEKSSCSSFEKIIDGCKVRVQLNAQGLRQLRVPVMNCFTWYWGVTVLDIWEIAFANNISDTRFLASDGEALAGKAVNHFRIFNPVRKVY